ncbi:DUF488 domain-containing protein [Actinomadura rupiterrae]|uniref:DUF488 domain-containing protein n=1 Tax=Actinomadura rupiterrae TaxID=559627 RepID=UPI0020A2822B|nr:DUF488 family protein [Actinomadura rupiterrae]MCP2337662.1 uncharacterized protein YeaO (DUF488 family) [Actinomadura rupiterrae]
MGEFRMRRAYDAPEEADGARVLVDRLWPRGLSKERADLTEWDKQVAPSDELRKWYGHDPARKDEFTRRYRAELDDPERAEIVDHLRELAEKGPVTLLTATKEIEASHLPVLRRRLQG